jgi:putative DNA primase/helicase
MSHRQPLPSLSELSRQASSFAAQIAEQLIGTKPTSRTGREVRFGRKGSFAVVAAGHDRGSFYDHENGVGGDVIDMVAHLRRCSIADAAAWVWDFLRLDGAGTARTAPRAAQTPEARPPDPPEAARSEEAVALWHESEAIDGTPGEACLRARNFEPDQLPPHTGLTGWPPTLRYHAGIGALLVAVNDPSTGLIVAVQRIFLRRDGTPKRRPDGRKIKLALGPTGNGNAVRFAWEPDPQGRWGVAEGAETALAAAQLFGLPVVASLGASNLPKVAPPSWATAVTVFADHDEAGLRAAKEAASALSARGLEVVIRRPNQPGQDYADVLLDSRAEAA